MTMAQNIFMTVVIMFLALGAWLTWQIRRRNLQQWLGGYLSHSIQRRFSPGHRHPTGPVNVLLCIADHFEPECGGATDAIADARVAGWIDDYPRLMGSFCDSDGRPPRHTFFYPVDQYEPRHVDALAELCRDGFGEVEIHLHHDHDSALNLEDTLRHFTQLFADRHGLLGRWPDGRIAYGFVHGNWALDNSRPDGRWCGVKNELDVLRRTGCYADFTFPSAPDITQTRKINSIYYAIGDAHRCKSHNDGVDVGDSAPPDNGLMLVQGPLRLWRPKGCWRPRIENACIQAGQPPTMERLDQWLRARIIVSSRKEWVFIKLHTHGANDANRRILLGKPMMDFHIALAERAAHDSNFRYHYVTAREIYNLAKAAEAGWTGSVQSALGRVIGPVRPDNALLHCLETE